MIYSEIFRTKKEKRADPEECGTALKL